MQVLREAMPSPRGAQELRCDSVFLDHRQEVGHSNSRAKVSAKDWH